MSTLVFDTETTGLIEPVKVIEAAWARLAHPFNLQGVEYWQGRFDPKRSIEFGAMSTHHITNKDLEGKPPSEEFSLPTGVEFLIGHNVDYDWGVIGKPPCRRICTLALCRMIWPEVDSHGLGAMMYFLEGIRAKELLSNAHSASADVTNTIILLGHIISNLPGDIITWEQVWEHSEQARIPKIITFGEHKGKLLADIPNSYVSWLLRQIWVDPYLADALRNRK